MIVNDVQDDSQPLLMTGIDQQPQPLRPSVGILNCKRIDAIVAPVTAAGELGNGHEFNSRDTEIFQFVQIMNNGLKGALWRERAYVKFVDNIVMQWQSAPAVILPGEVWLDYL